MTELMKRYEAETGDLKPIDCCTTHLDADATSTRRRVVCTKQEAIDAWNRRA